MFIHYFALLDHALPSLRRSRRGFKSLSHKMAQADSTPFNHHGGMRAFPQRWSRHGHTHTGCTLRTGRSEAFYMSTSEAIACLRIVYYPRLTQTARFSQFLAESKSYHASTNYHGVYRNQKKIVVPKKMTQLTRGCRVKF